MLPCERKNAINSHTVLFGVQETEMKANYIEQPLCSAENNNKKGPLKL